ncbi:U3 snoRNP protein [Irineochytrium annulatum]|nr:U3 snoRNP protein [Irineochytrium annulatum]
MAESVQFHLERMLPELEDLEERGVFKKPEIKAIVKRRTALEYALHRRITRRADYLRYIEYETNLEKLRRKRKRRLKLDIVTTRNNANANNHSNVTLSDFSIVRRIHHLYQGALKKFPGDINLWLQYFEWSRSTGSSRALGRTFAKALSLHPGKPPMWILAAKWEFEENANMTAARVLLQRGIRVNAESTSLWLEYFKLELLWLAKVVERRRILFGGVGGAEKRKKARDGADEDRNEGIELSALEEEAGARKSPLDMDPTISASNGDLAGEGAMAMGEQLTPLQEALMGASIPRAIYKNAIKEMPNDLDFRIAFLKIAEEFGELAVAVLDDIYASLLSDFDAHATAMGIVAERPLSGILVTDPTYPLALRSVVKAYEGCLEKLSTMKMWDRYIDFVSTAHSENDEENLLLYLSTLLRKLRTRADELSLASESVYVSWSDSLSTSDAKCRVLDRGIERYPQSVQLRLAKVGALLMDDGGAGKKRKVVNRKTRAKAVMEVFEDALLKIGVGEPGSMRTESQLLDRGAIWKGYLSWVADDETGCMKAETVEKLFRTALSISEMGATSVEDSLLMIYLDWSLAVGGIGRVREAYERLLTTRQRSAAFLHRCVEIERAISERERVEASGDGDVDAMTEDRDFVPSNLDQMRRLFEIYCNVDIKSLDPWLEYLEFEIFVAKDLTVATQLHWRASKAVGDQDDFVRRYDELKNGRKGTES